MNEPNIHKRLESILEMDDRFQRLRAIDELRKLSSANTLACLITLLDHPDEKVCGRAAHGLSVFHKLNGVSVSKLCEHLRRNSSPDVRLCCAIKLMRVETPEVDATYLSALTDPDEKVTQVACMQLGFRTQIDASAALASVLTRPEWQVRLEGCKALITRKTVGERVLSTLEAMMLEPEAAEYDAQIDEFEAIDAEIFSNPEAVSDENETWGKMETIHAQAKALAAS